MLCYHSAPERSLYSIAEVTRDPYPDPHDYDGKNLVADLRAFEKLPRPVTLAEMRASGVREVAMEVSSQALDQDRVAGVNGVHDRTGDELRIDGVLGAQLVGDAAHLAAP